MGVILGKTDYKSEHYVFSGSLMLTILLVVFPLSTFPKAEGMYILGLIRASAGFGEILAV